MSFNSPSYSQFKESVKESHGRPLWLYFMYKRWPPTMSNGASPLSFLFSSLSQKDSGIHSLVLSFPSFDTPTLHLRRRAPRHDIPQSHLHQARQDAHATFFWACGKTHATTLKFQGLHQRFVLFLSPSLSLFTLFLLVFFSIVLWQKTSDPVPSSNIRSSTLEQVECWHGCFVRQGVHWEN